MILKMPDEKRLATDKNGKYDFPLVTQENKIHHLLDAPLPFQNAKVKVDYEEEREANDVNSPTFDVEQYARRF